MDQYLLGNDSICGCLPFIERVSQFEKTVIPGGPNDVGRDPESRKITENQIILDPGSHPAPRELAGMTN